MTEIAVDPSHRPFAPDAPRRRSDAVDFWRGFVLCTIFVNHVPGNLFEPLTFKNLGFSDSSEAFVFMSGLSMAMAYGPRFLAGKQRLVMGSLARRTAKLYGVHIVLSLLGLAIFAMGAALFENPDLMQAHGRDLFMEDGAAALLGLVSLGHQLGYFNILPLYVVLVAMVPGLLWLARRSLPLMLAASLAFYLATRVTGWNVPTWPLQGAWFFDPFAWQFLMAIGLAVGLGLRTAPIRADPLLTGCAAGMLLVCAWAVTDGLAIRPGLLDEVRGWADLDKTMLGAGRLIHFICLAYLVHALDLANWLRRTPCFGPLCTIGRNGLLAFTLLSALAAVAQVVTMTFGHPVLLDVLLIGGGLAAIYGASLLVEAGRGVVGRSAVPHAPGVN